MKPPPDAYALGFVALALAGDWLLPLGVLPDPGLTAPLSWIGAALMLAGFALELAAGRALSAAATTLRPFGTPAALVTGGVFARSRNPLYVGMLMLLGGLALTFALEWGFVLLPLMWLCLDRLVVPAEEAALRKAFPEAWGAYAGRVRRWV